MKIYSFVLTTSLRELSQVWGSLSVKLHIFASYYNSSLKDAVEKLTNNSEVHHKLQCTNNENLSKYFHLIKKMLIIYMVYKCIWSLYVCVCVCVCTQIIPKHFYTAKEIVNNLKRQPTKWEKIHLQITYLIKG